MTFSRTSVFKSNGIYELPFGKGRAMMRNASRVVDGILGGWKGPDARRDRQPFQSYGTASVQWQRRCYFCGFKQIPDPGIASLTSAIASRSTLFAQQGPNSVILQNPLPGTVGNLAQTFFTSPNFFNLDASLAKQFRLIERFNFELRADFLNSTNHPDFSNATLDSNIDSVTFGRFTAFGSANNNRIIVLGGRLNW
jgi:hypothetical protein